MKQLSILFVFIFCMTATAQEVLEQERISYGQIADQISQHIRANSDKFYDELEKKFKQKCRGAKDSYTVKGIKLKCNMNLKKISLGHKQEVLRAQMLPQYFGKHSGSKVYLDNKLVIKASVKGKHVNFPVKLIDDLSATTSVVEKKRLDKNITIRHTPVGRSLYTTACIDLPGVELLPTVNAPIIYVKKKKFLVSAKVKVKLDLDLGKFIVRSAKACGVYKLELDDGDITRLSQGGTDGFFNPERLRSLIRPSDVHVLPLKVSKIVSRGFKIKKAKVVKKNLWAKVASLFTNVEKQAIDGVKKGVREEIKKQISSYLNVANGAIMSGDLWGEIATVTGLRVQNQLADNLQSLIAEQTADNVVDSFRVDAQAFISQCNSMHAQIVADMPIFAISNRCEETIEKIEFVPFYFKQDLKDKGCYSRYYIPTPDYKLDGTSVNKAWRDDCYLSSALKITANPEFEESVSCIVEATRRGLNEEQTMQNCGETMLAEYLGIPLQLAQKIYGVSSPQVLATTLDPSEMQLLSHVLQVEPVNVPPTLMAESPADLSGVLSEEQLRELAERGALNQGSDEDISLFLASYDGTEDQAAAEQNLACSGGIEACMYDELPTFATSNNSLEEARIEASGAIVSASITEEAPAVVPKKRDTRRVAADQSRVQKANKKLRRAKKQKRKAKKKVKVAKKQKRKATKRLKKTKKKVKKAKKRVKKAKKKVKKAKKRVKKAKKKVKKAKKKVKKAKTKKQKKKAKKQVKKAKKKVKKAKKQVKKATKKVKKAKKQVKKATKKVKKAKKQVKKAKKKVKKAKKQVKKAKKKRKK